MSQASSPKIYFPGLNGLRFFAALAVMITHVELLKSQCGFPARWDLPFFHEAGSLGVYFFFVLSGYLITYLLMAEKQHTGTISIKAFYLRRILRIWPLYFLLVILGFFVFPHFDILTLSWHQKFFNESFTLKIVLFLAMLPNLALSMFPAVSHIGQLWSIGVEEQFYALWPWIVDKSRNLLRTIIATGLIIVLIKALVLLIVRMYPDSHALQVLKTFAATTKMESMAIGAAGAWLAFHRREKWLRVIFHPLLQAGAYLLIPVLIFFTPDVVQDGVHLLYSLSFLVIIMNVSLNGGSFLKLENRLMNFLGEISYGLYMYHMFIIVLVIRLIYPYLSRISPLLADAGVYSGAILLTVLVSAVSYRYFERPFIRLKRRFALVKSGSDARKEEA